MKGAWIAAAVLLACSLCFGSHASEVVSYQEVGEREYRDRQVVQPVWPNERDMPEVARDEHELYPWQSMPDIEFDGEREARSLPPVESDHHTQFGPEWPRITVDGGQEARLRPPIEFDHHTVFGPAMPDIEFDGGNETRCRPPRRYDGNSEARLWPSRYAW
jgi:hypothetical protein